MLLYIFQFCFICGTGKMTHKWVTSWVGQTAPNLDDVTMLSHSSAWAAAALTGRSADLNQSDESVSFHQNSVWPSREAAATMVTAAFIQLLSEDLVCLCSYLNYFFKSVWINRTQTVMEWYLHVHGPQLKNFSWSSWKLLRCRGNYELRTVLQDWMRRE